MGGRVPIAIFPADEVLAQVGPERRTFCVRGETFNVKMHSPRLQIFKLNPTCVQCGRTGVVMTLDLPSGQAHPHFNMHSVEPDGSMVLMTKDHIVAKSKGGSDGISNLQTMCEPCNHKKADT